MPPRKDWSRRRRIDSFRNVTEDQPVASDPKSDRSRPGFSATREGPSVRPADGHGVARGPCVFTGLGAAAGVGLLGYIMPDSPRWSFAFVGSVVGSLFETISLALWNMYGFDYGWWKAGLEDKRQERKNKKG